MKILAVDTGFGDVKIVYGDHTKIVSMYKFPSTAAEVKLNSMVKDDRVITYNDKSYYIGKDALHVQSSSIIDIDSYDKLEYFSPLFLYKTLNELQIIPDIIVLGLSIAQINNSGHYKNNVEEFLHKSGINSTVYIVPQGLISKLAVDKWGTDFPDFTKDYSKESSYVIADIGFNTLDIVHVVNGSASSNLVRGIENRGAVLIVNDLIVDIKERHNIELNISEAKEVLSTGVLKRRGVTYSVEDLIINSKVKYIDNLKVIIENEFGDILDKVDGLVIVGGGSYILNPGDKGFVRGPKQGAEFYNALGYYQYGLTKTSSK